MRYEMRQDFHFGYTLQQKTLIRCSVQWKARERELAQCKKYLRAFIVDVGDQPRYENVVFMS